MHQPRNTSDCDQHIKLTMKPTNFIAFALLAMGASFTTGFTIPTHQSKIQVQKFSSIMMKMTQDHTPTRRTMLTKTTVSFFGSLFLTNLAPLPSFAEPSVTTEEFEKILKDSYRSIQSVEFSGPKSETCKVKLVDGTTFFISDLVESPTDPRSPLKLQSICRGYNIPTKNLALEGALSSTPKKKKVYMNSRVQEAAVKEAEKKERLKADEENRLRALFLMEEEEAMRAERVAAERAATASIDN